MQGFLTSIRLTAIAIFAYCAATSCVYDNGMDDEPVIPENRAMLNLGLNFPMALAESGNGNNGYVPGTGYENYIDFAKGGYRIYFFGTDNKYLARFIPLMYFPVNGAYNVVGTVPEEVEKLQSFKIVVLANWPSYPDESLVAGTTTIKDMCSSTSAQFDALTSFDLNPDAGRTIPFYGVHEYMGVKFEKGTRTTLAEPVALLRAMAKVEVVVDIAGVSLSGIGLRGFNSKGFCAPDEVYSHTQYDHGGIWEQDYVKTPHLVGNANDANQGAAILPFLRKNGEDKETWIAYVPEYANVTADYKSRIEFKLDIQDANTAPYEVYFADYDTTGKIIADSYHDILRNNCYRFTVSLDGGLLILKTEKWENAYDNKFTFE